MNKLFIINPVAVNGLTRMTKKFSIDSFRRRVSGNGTQHSVSRDVSAQRQPRQIRCAPRSSTDGERPDRPSRAYRRP